MPDPDLSYIVAPLRPLAVPIESLVTDPTNARMHDERNLTTIDRSMARFGQRTPLVVQRDGMIVRKGNGTLEIAKRRGWTHIAAVILDDTSDEGIQYAIVDNRSSELANWNWGVLVPQLDEISLDDPGYDFDDLGWGQEIDNLIQADWSPPVRGQEDNDSEGDESEGKRHHIALNVESNEIFQRAFEKLKASGGLPDNASEGFAIATLADFWLGRAVK